MLNFVAKSVHWTWIVNHVRLKKFSSIRVYVYMNKNATKLFGVIIWDIILVSTHINIFAFPIATGHLVPNCDLYKVKWLNKLTSIYTLPFSSQHAVYGNLLFQGYVNIFILKGHKSKKSEL